jgi:3-oxoadipate CoA-transferase alpha subunit
MIDKRAGSVAEALDRIRDGAVVLLGGFGAVGQANELVEGLIEQGARDLTIVANNAGSSERGLPQLLAAGRVRRVVCSFPRGGIGSSVFEELFKAGKVELEIVPQGTLAERLRAAGAGIPAFYTPTGVGTVMAQGKELRDINGRMHMLEYALPGDIALIEAWQADRWGNLVYRGAARNFNPIMASAASRTIVQTNQLVELGELDPEVIVTPGIFVDRVVRIDSHLGVK